jgi:hypothetical protein
MNAARQSDGFLPQICLRKELELARDALEECKRFTENA